MTGVRPKIGSIFKERFFQNRVAAEVTRLKLEEFQRIWSLLTSAATVLKKAQEINIFPSDLTESGEGGRRTLLGLQVFLSRQTERAVANI
jgi:hypothetical protein